jgi:hypothetical protein
MEWARLDTTRSLDKPHLGAHITHRARHDRTGHHDLLTMLAHGASGKQGHDMEPSPLPSASRRGDVSVIIYMTSKARLLDKEGGMAPGLPSS